MRYTLPSSFLPVVLLISFADAAHAQYPNKNPDRSSRGPSVDMTRLQSKGPGHSALVTMNDGTLRSGWITAVGDNELKMERLGTNIQVPLSDVAMVKIERSDRTLLYGAIGYVVTATVAGLVAHNNGADDFKDQVIIVGVGGIPGAVLGALLGHKTSGDVEIIP